MAKRTRAAKTATDMTYRDRLRVTILTNAGRIVAKDGLSALQARSVAALSNCSVGTVYNVFGDLDGLITAVNDRTLEQLSEPLNAAYEKNKSKSTAHILTELALAYMNFAFRHQAGWRAVFEHRPAKPSASDKYRATQASLLALIETTIAGEIKAPAARARAARALFGSVHGIITLAIDDRMSPFDARVVESEIRFIVAAAAKGLSST